MSEHINPEEIARRGDQIYEESLRQELEAGLQGEIVAIDIHSRDYAVGVNAMEAGRILRMRHPDAAVWLVRIGHRGLHRIGAVYESVRVSETGGLKV